VKIAGVLNGARVNSTEFSALCFVRSPWNPFVSELLRFSCKILEFRVRPTPSLSLSLTHTHTHNIRHFISGMFHSSTQIPPPLPSAHFPKCLTWPLTAYRKTCEDGHPFNPLNTKRRPLYWKTQFVPRSKHFSSRL
jgi:hypothetical protein